MKLSFHGLVLSSMHWRSQNNKFNLLILIVLLFFAVAGMYFAISKLNYKTLNYGNEIIMADEELELDVTQPKSSKLTIILIVALTLLVLILGGVGAWLYLSNDADETPENVADDAVEKVQKPLIYQDMVPEFVVNFGPGSKVRYLQVDLQVASRDPDAIEAVNTYRPVLRNDILVLLSGQNFEDLSSRNGKEALQQKLLNVINKIIVDAMHKAEEKEGATTATQKEEVKGPIENVYFTSFIMQ